MNIIRGKQNKAQRVVVYGPEGIGKSTFGSQFPNPIFIDTEGSTEQLDVARTQKPSSWTMLRLQVEEIAQYDFKTLIIDTIDWAERLCIEHICAKANKSSIEDFGYGKGYTHLEEEFGKFLNLLNDIREKGINVVLLAHSQMRKFEQPDEMGAYDRWELKLSKKCSPLVKEWADMLLFANYKTFVIEDDKTKSKKAQGGRRIMHTSHHPCYDAKNRHDLPEELEFNFSNIAHIFSNVATRSELNSKVETAKEAEPDHDKLEREAIDNPAVTAPQPTGTKIPLDNPPGFPIKLFELMQQDGISEEQIRRAVHHKGYYPLDRPIDRYDDGFVDGVLVAAWPKVKEIIKELEFEPVA